MRNAISSSRAAFTLIEMVMSLTIGSLVVLLAVGLIHKTFHLSKAAKSRTELSAGFDRLVDDLRTDLYSAESYQVADDGVSIEFYVEGSQWSYRSQGDYLERAVLEGGKFRALDRVRLNGSAINARERSVQFSVKDQLVSLRLYATHERNRILEREVVIRPSRWKFQMPAEKPAPTQAEVEAAEKSNSLQEAGA